MSNEPNESTLSGEEVQDSSAGSAAGTANIEEVQRELNRLKLEVENAHRLAEQERKRADDLIGLVGTNQSVNAKPPPEDLASVWNKMVSELSPEQYEAKISQRVAEEVMRNLQSLGAQSQRQQSERQYFNTSYPDLKGVNDRVLMAAYQSVLDRNPQIQNYSVETKAEYIAKELREWGMGGNDATKQNRIPPKDAPSSPASQIQSHEKDEFDGLTVEQAEKKAFKKMLEQTKPAYKQVR